MNTHNIINVVYAQPKPENGYKKDAPVIVTKSDGTTRNGYANDDIEGGGVSAFLADGGMIDKYVAPIVTREDWRKTASLTRAEFVDATADMGLLTNDEAVAAAKGDWPSSFDIALPDNPTYARKSKVLWATVTEIKRNADLIQAIIASPIPVTDEQVDALFGYEI